MNNSRCADWSTETNQQLSVTCDGLTGKWAPTAGEDPNNYYEGPDGVLGTQPTALLEHQCIADPRNPLTVDIANMGAGAQLSCETPPEVDGPPATTYTIAPPNKCVLLCDYHLAMTIEGRLSDEGELKFYVANSEPEQVIDETNVSQKVKCWPDRE